MKKRQYYILFFIILLAVFFYSFNLRHTYFFAGDMARDTLASLRILNNKEITAIGPPLSFGQYGTREIYFGSLSYYAGALGLLLFKKDVLGPVYINIFLMILGIYFFYKLARQFFSLKTAFFATIIFSLTPTIVAHMRFFWNPNFIISLGPIYWYFYFLSIKSKKWYHYLLTGILAGVLFNFHYFIIFTFFLSLLFIYFKDKKGFLIILLSFILAISPLIIFEIKNKFYLLNAFVYNITLINPHHNSYQLVLSRPIWLKITDIFLIPAILLSFATETTYFPPILNLNYRFQVLIGMVIYFFIIKFFLFKKTIKNNQWSQILILIFSTAFFSSLLSQNTYYIRYFFICLPLLVLVLVKTFKNKFLFFTVLIIFIITDFKILYSQKALTDIFAKKESSYPTITHMEKVAKIIKKENPQSPYNITENFIGEARALYLRFFLERDNQIPKLKDELTYQNLKELYVFSPSLKEIYKDNRWEFNATPNLKLTKTWYIDKNKYLFKFEKINY